MTPRSSRVAACVLMFQLSLLSLTACDASTRDDAPAGAAPQHVAPSASADGTAVVFSRAGVTVHLPGGCQPREVEPGSCEGLQALRVARIGPSLDLMLPGVREGRAGTWVGLRILDESYVFAEANNPGVIYELFASATATST